MAASESDLPPSEIEDAANAGLIPQLSMMLRALIASTVFLQLVFLGLGIFLVVVATAYAQIRLNSWNQPFYNALSTRDVPAFMQQLGVFGELAVVLLVLNVAQRWLGEMTKLKLREGLVQDLIKQWLAQGRAFKLESAGPIGVNPDQRMHEDARHLTELSSDLGVGLLQSTVLLASFVSVLWSLSSNFQLRIGGTVLAIPGYMVWAAVIYAGSASALTYLSGRRLIPQNAERYAREAQLRFSLMRVNENIDAIELSGGVALEEARLKVDLQAVLAAMRRLVGGLTRLTWVTAGYGWFTLIAPILVATPVYFNGLLTFGGLMMAAGAFNQVQSSLRWYIDNFSSIADWRATLLRVASFRAAVMASDTLHTNESEIAFEAGPPGKMEMSDLEIASHMGCHRLEDKSLELHPGERVVIATDPEASGELLFRALAGLWPWGSGKIVRPTPARISYIPRRPYVPVGNLRDVLAYPSAVGVADEAYSDVLSQVGLERLQPSLNDDRNWGHELDEAERLAIAIARAQIQKAEWLIIDEALDTLNGDALDQLLNVLTRDFASSAILYIGRAAIAEKLNARVSRLIPDPKCRLLRRGVVSAADAPQPALEHV